MANELKFDAGQTGLTAYAVAYNAAGEFVYADGSVIEAYDASHWTDYAIPFTEVGSTGIYFGDFPAVAAGNYTFTIRQQAGAGPVPGPETDIRIGLASGDWNGTEFVWLNGSGGNIEANVAKVNGTTIGGSGTRLDPWGPA